MLETLLHLFQRRVVGPEIARTAEPLAGVGARAGAVDGGQDLAGLRGDRVAEMGAGKILVELADRHRPLVQRRLTCSRPGLARLDGRGVIIGGDPRLVPGGAGQGGDVRRKGLRAPMDAQQAVAAQPLGIDRVVPHAAGPGLVGHEVRIVLHPGNRPLGAAVDVGEGGLDRVVAHVAVDAAHGALLGKQCVQGRTVMLRPQHPAAGGQRTWLAGRRQGVVGGADVADRRRELLPDRCRPRSSPRASRASNSPPDRWRRSA